ncbi:hypothetical protein [Pedobacter boryungensis]|uniref:DUF4252 domain-containing protein n=1 Tax=Pedobacter boryungensis TaxID=869962 RepID=A0ABX2DDD5_9SPHI|nr:hypothetical protein [Pedobacter boryungensis]NQX31144.1 hypothetical protein [Pedobacter boryungensis]
MLKKSILLLFVVVSSIQVNAQKDWFKQKINDKVSVNFPIEPKKINEQSYGVRDQDNVVYLVSVVDLLKTTGLSLEDFNAGVVKQTFADEFMEGLMPTMAKYTFKPAKIIAVKGNTAYSVFGRDDVNKNTLYMNIVFVDGIAYSITSILPDGKDFKNISTYLNEIYINGK